MRNGGIILTLDVLIWTAINIDNKLYEQAIEKKYNFNPYRTYRFNSSIKNNHATSDPIDLSTT